MLQHEPRGHRAESSGEVEDGVVVVDDPHITANIGIGDGEFGETVNAPDLAVVAAHPGRVVETTVVREQQFLRGCGNLLDVDVVTGRAHDHGPAVADYRVVFVE